MLDDDSLESYSIPAFSLPAYPEYFGKNERKIRMSLKKNGKITVPWAKKHLGINEDVARRTLKRLEKDDFVTSDLVKIRGKGNVINIRVYTINKEKKK